MAKHRIIPWLLTGTVVLAVAKPPLAAASRLLFLDPAILAQSENVSINVNPPVEHEVVIRAD